MARRGVGGEGPPSTIPLNLDPVRDAPHPYAPENPSKQSAKVAALLWNQWQASSGIRRQIIQPAAPC